MGIIVHHFISVITVQTMTQRPNDPTTQIEIGAVRPDELESLFGLICEVFQLPYEPAREIFYNDPYLDLENKRVLRVNGRIVSCLNIADREVWLGGGVVRVGGIAGVATHPDERGKGYASLLLANTLDFLKAQGYALSALVPYSAHFYRRLGYEICGNACRFVTSPAYLPKSHEARNVRPARSDDAPQLAACYTGWAEPTQFFGIRDEQRWRYLLKNVEQCYLYREQSGEISGYVLLDTRQNLLAFEGDISMPTLRVLEMITTTNAARRGLLAYLAAQTTAGMIEFTVPSYLLWDLDRLAGTGIGEEILGNIEVVPMLMARVLNVRPIIEANLAYVLWEGGLRLEIRDPINPPRSESWTILRDAAGETIRPSNESDSTLPCLTADIRVWAQVMTGFKWVDDAVMQGLLFASDDTAHKRGNELFMKYSPFLPLPDHF